MDFPARISQAVGQLPPDMKALVDSALAAGHKIIDVESEASTGKVCLIIDQPLKIPTSPTPPGVTYRQSEDSRIIISGFYSDGDRFSLVAIKFKPMVLQPLPEGPGEPAARKKEVEPAGASKTAVPVFPVPGSAAERFIASMKITYDMWHDGDGYDLSALALLSPAERDAIEKLLISHSPRDWRDIEALGQFNTPSARRAVELAMSSSDADVRRVAMDYAPVQLPPADRERLLLGNLRKNDLFAGLGAAIDEAAEFHPPAVVEALLRGALDRNGEIAVHFAALLFFIHGKASEPFDWKQRPFFLRFNTTSRTDRVQAFRELCQTIGVDAGPYVR